MNEFNFSDFERLPEIEKYREGLGLLRTYDFTGNSIFEISKLVAEKTIILPTITSTTEINNLGFSLFYRVRLIDHNKMGYEDMSNIQSFSYPSASFCTENGRANLKNTSVFYCASTGDAAMQECNIEIGSEGFLSVWSITPGSVLKFGLLLSEDLPKQNPWRLVVDHIYDENFQNLYFIKEGKYSEHMRELRSFLYKQYMYEEKPYPITSFISNRLLYQRDDLDFIAYPCVKRAHKQINFAFHPNSADQFLNIERVFKFKVTAIDDEGVSYIINGVGDLTDRKIIWRNFKKSDEKYLGAVTPIL
jgi:hypothetical protein